MAINKINSHNLFNDRKIHEGYQRRAMIRNHLSGLYQKQIESDISHQDARTKLKLLEEQNRLLKKQYFC
jgi:hypothetical protein